MAWGFGNIGGGSGGLSSAYAQIYVEYDAEIDEVICTNSKGSVGVTETSKIFKVADGATSCILTSKKNNETVATRTVTGIQNGKSYCVHLTSTMYLDKSGDPYLDSAGGWSLFSATGSSSSTYTAVKPHIRHNFGSDINIFLPSGKYGGLVRTKNTIDLTPYKMIYCYGKSLTNTNSNTHAYFLILPSNYTYWGDSYSLKRVEILTEKTYSMDISNIKQSCYIGFGISCTMASVQTDVYLYNIWLTQ